MKTLNAPQYLQLNKGGSMARLSVLKMKANDFNRSRPPGLAIDWRKARAYTFGNWRAAYCDMSRGFNDGKTPVWCAHTGEQFRNERFCDDVSEARIGHTGWFCDVDQGNKARGIVGMLTHGRYIAGWMSDNDERVYFDEVFDNEVDAARMADEHARVIAEQESEYNARFHAAQNLETDIDDSFTRLRECLVLRNVACMEYVRDEARGLIECIRSNRETLKTDYAGVL